jgi:hypothetical protein
MTDMLCVVDCWFVGIGLPHHIGRNSAPLSAWAPEVCRQEEH